MKPLSHQFLTALPAVVAVMLTLLAATPLDTRFYSLTPNIACLMTIVMVVYYPPAWPRGFAFFLGLLQDVLLGTPLGSQALLMLLLAQYMTLPYLQNVSLFRQRWLQTTGILVAWHVLLWALMHLLGDGGPSLRGLLQVSMVNALWYPLVHGFVRRFFANLPDAK